MASPSLPLVELKELVAAENFTWNYGPNCGRVLMLHLRGELLLFRPFIKRVVEELTDGDFWRTGPMEGTEIIVDEYGIRLSSECVETFSLKVSTWYVKVNEQRNRDGRSAFFLSLHPLAYDMRRVGGLLKPES